MHKYACSGMDRRLVRGHDVVHRCMLHGGIFCSVQRRCPLHSSSCKFSRSSCFLVPVYSHNHCMVPLIWLQCHLHTSYQVVSPTPSKDELNCARGTITHAPFLTQRLNNTKARSKRLYHGVKSDCEPAKIEQGTNALASSPAPWASVAAPAFAAPLQRTPLPVLQSSRYSSP